MLPDEEEEIIVVDQHPKKMDEIAALVKATYGSAAERCQRCKSINITYYIGVNAITQEGVEKGYCYKCGYGWNR